MVHQGKRLQELVKLKKLTQKEITEKMGYADRASFVRYYDKEILPQAFVTRVAEALGVDTSAFGQQTAVVATPLNEPVGCWQQLAEARQEIIDLQKQVLAMTRPSINAPRVAKQSI